MSRIEQQTTHRRTRAGTRAAWLTVIAWVMLCAGGAFFAGSVSTTLKDGGWTVGSAPAQHVADAQTDGFVGRGTTSMTLVVTDERATASDEDFRSRATDVVERFVAMPQAQVTSHVGYADGGAAAAGFLGQDRRTTITQIGSSIEPGVASVTIPALQKSLDETYAGTGQQVRIVSPDAFWGQVNADSMAGLVRAEMITLPAILIVLLLLYRSVAASLVSLGTTVVAVVVSVGAIDIIGRFVDLSSFTLNAVTMLGLGVCIDYSLFVIRRFQREVDRSDLAGALAAVRRTAAHTVIASGLTVAVAMATLFLVDLTIIRSLALGVVVVVIVSMVVNVTLVPALLALLGRRINWGRLPRRRREVSSDGVSRFAKVVLARPGSLLALGVLAMGLLAMPAKDLTTFTPDARIVSEGSSVREGYDTVARQFSVGAAAPIQVLIEAESGTVADIPAAALTQFENRLRAIEHVTSVSTPTDILGAVSPQAPLAGVAALDRLDPGTRAVVGSMVSADQRRMLISIVVDDWAAGPDTRHALSVVESTAADAGLGARVYVGGETALGSASNEVISDALPRVVIAMLVVIFVLLMMTFRSLVIPPIAIAMNLLSVGATYGVMVLVFQQGHVADLMGFTALGYLQNFVPVLLLALLFSLATDYQVFLLASAKEEFDEHGDSALALGRALTLTGPIITGAAVLMVLVFGAFASTGIVPIQQLGFGLAVGILVDATVVRMVLVPAALRLVGRGAWWMPGRGRRYRGRHAVDGVRGRIGVDSVATDGTLPVQDPDELREDAADARQTVRV